MSECRIVDLKELGVSEEVFYKIYSMGEEDGRTDAIAEISREMRMLYGNEYEKQIRAEELDKISKMMLLGCDELKCEECDYRLYSQDVCQQAYTIGIIEKYIAEQLKEQK